MSKTVIRRIKKELPEDIVDQFVGEPNPDKALLAEIKKGFHVEGYKDEFYRQRHIYITGKDPVDNVTAGLPPLVDTIRQSIIRMKRQIRVLDLPSPKYPSHAFSPDIATLFMDS